MQTSKLIVLRGPSGSGKSSAARGIREGLGRGVAIIEQDYLRRIILREKDVPNGLNIQLIKKTTLFLLRNSYDVILEGIFDTDRYAEMFQEIIALHPKNNFFYYFNVSFQETVRRHQFKDNKDDFGEKEMKQWYKKEDFLAPAKEKIIPEQYTLEQTVQAILQEIKPSASSLN